jgi:perosamine synthetase
MIPQFEPFVGEEEKTLLCKCIDDKWITSGPRVAEFESKIADLCKVKYAVTISNGTLAIFVALKACGVEPGDHVVVPDFTFFATAAAVVMAGAKPIFADIDPVSLCITPESVNAVLTTETVAVMPVGMYGQCSRWDELERLCASKGLMMIEDAAQNTGSFYKGRAIGTYGLAGTYSYYGDKVLSCGEGGMVVTDNIDVYNKCLKLKYQGNTSMGQGYIHQTIGWNFRMSDLNAAVGLAQFSKLRYIIDKKRGNETRIKRLLKDVHQVSFMQIDKDCMNVPFRNIIFVPDAKKLCDYLISKDIGARTLFYPLHRQPPFMYKVDRPVSDSIYSTGVSLPSSVRLTEGEIDYICRVIKEYYR